MAEENDSLSPSGDQVVQTGVRGLGDFFRALGNIAVTGISRKVDLELMKDAPVPDTTETAPITHAKPSPPASTGFSDVVRNLTPVQWGGLALAGVGIWALATGKFR